jgi:CubicO group peptidase (beta-lactamase class C family)
MYITLSHLPPTLLNQTYESYIAEHLFAPLGMASSTYSVGEAEERGTLAHGFHWDMQDHLFGLNGTRTATVPHFQRPGEEKISAGAGGVLASARDLVNFHNPLFEASFLIIPSLCGLPCS